VDRFKRVAIVHDWLVSYAGSERVLREILALYPQAELFAIVDFLSDADREKLSGKRAVTSFIQRLPQAAKRYRGYLPLMPLAIEQLDVSAYDLVISSSHAVAKGILTGPDQIHVCYCHTPIRYAWDLQHQYLREARLIRGAKAMLARAMLHYIRFWDSRTAAGVDYFIANSYYIARRIAKVYGRGAAVVHPPVDVDRFSIADQKSDFYLTASRMVPYKRMDLIVEAFRSLPDQRLIVIGDGPERNRIVEAAGDAPNITFLGYQDDAVLREHLRQARAFVFAAEEDFGILPVEAMASGTPVIAYGRGGVLDSVVGWAPGDPQPATGLFFDEQTQAAICKAVMLFERHRAQISPIACRARAERFSAEHFRAAFKDVIDKAEAARSPALPVRPPAVPVTVAA
jgi:glycosyltransferase involved in cell wall biosynthesis